MSYDPLFFKHKVALITGCHQNIGAQIARTLADKGCHLILTAPSDKNIDALVQECQKPDNEVLTILSDLQNEEEISRVISKVGMHFGKLDILINSAYENHFTNAENTPIDNFHKMQQVNTHIPYMLSQSALMYLRLSDNAHIVNLSPPIVLNAEFIHPYLPYAMSLYSISLSTLGMAHAHYHDNIAVNSIWPHMMITGMANVPDKYTRKPTIIADAILEILNKETRVCTGCFLIDDQVMMGAGVTDFSLYAHTIGEKLVKNIFLPPDLSPLG